MKKVQLTLNPLPSKVSHENSLYILVSCFNRSPNDGSKGNIMRSYLLNFDPEKAIEVILYIANKIPVPTIYYINKLLYFADKAHLQNFGRLICGDEYVAMRNGPVPSHIYDILKDVRDDRPCSLTDHAKHTFEIRNGRDIIPYRQADLDIFSDSDIECLDYSIQEYGKRSFNALKRLSHDDAWKSADENDFIDVANIISTLPDGEKLLQHLKDPFPG